MMKKGNKVGDSSGLKNVDKKGNTVKDVPKDASKKGITVTDSSVLKDGGQNSPVNIQIEVTNASTPSTASNEDLLSIEQGQKREATKEGIVNPVFTTQGEIIKTDSANPDIVTKPGEHPKPDIHKNADGLTKPNIHVHFNHDIHNSDGLLNPNIHINPDGLIDPNGPNDLDILNELETIINPVDGLDNPVFSIETASDTSKANTPEKVPSRFSFSDNDVNQFNQQVESQTSKQYLTPSCKANHSTPSSGLTVPDITGSRRPSDPLTFVQDDNFSQLQPLTTSNGLSKSEGRLPPLSPGYLTPCPYDRFQPPNSPGLLSTNSAWSELAKLHSRRSSYGDYTEDSGGMETIWEESTNSNSLSVVSSSLSEHLHNLVRAFSSRTERVKETTIQPPTPSSQDEYDTYSDANSAISAMDEPEQRQHRLDSFIPMHLRERGPMGQSDDGTLDEYFLECGCCKTRLPSWLKNMCSIPRTLEPQSKLYMTWLFLVTLCFMYNAWVIPLRGIFPYQNSSNLIYWLICDYTCDAIYILDMLVVKPHLTYLNSGLAETNPKLMRKNYMQKRMFKFDVLSLLPLDLFYLLWGVVPWFRLPRLLKIQTFWEFYQRCDQAVKSAHVLRIIKTMTYMLFLIHLETCGYYSVSVYEGIGSNRWVYNGEGIAYIRCFYLATKTATSIGNNPIPTNTLEYIFMTIYWVSGVFVFALLIGQIRDIVDAAGRVKAQYDKMMDDALRYVKNLNCPNDTQRKVRTWFLYQWQQQKISDEKKLMDWLPKNLRTDLAIHVHFNTLSKVTLFQDCDKTLLFDLVLKLKPILFLPGEYVCKKGEVGKEMYIVSQGHVEVVGGPDGATVLATLKEGCVFGEISLLAIAADGNRRTADVRCKGFTNLFILSQTEFEDAMAEYPEAHKLLKKRAKKLLRQNAKLSSKSPGSTGSSKVGVEPIIRTPSRDTETPKLFKTVLQKWEQKNQMIDPDSSVAKRLGSYSSEHKNSMTMESINETAKSDQIVDKPLPDADEAEDFYSKMLETELMDQETYEAVTSEAEKKLLQRNDTLNTDHSVDSTDSGVQMPKVSSPPESIGKTTSNKDSKESFVGSELNGNFEETCNWVIKQALSTPQVEKRRRHSRVEDEAQVQKIVEVLTKQNRVMGVNRKDEVELMSSFFEDNDPSENVLKVQQVAADKDSGQTCERGRVGEKCGVDKDGKIEQTIKDVIPAKDQVKKNAPSTKHVDVKTPEITVMSSEGERKSDNSDSVFVNSDQDATGKTTSNNGAGNTTSNNGAGNTTSNNGAGNTTSNNGAGNTTSNNGAGKTTSNNGAGNTISSSGANKATSNNSTVEAKSTNGGANTTSNNGGANTTSNNGGANTTSNNGGANTTSNNGGANTTSNNGGANTTSNNGGANTTSNNGGANTTSNNGGANTTSNNGANKATSNNGRDVRKANNASVKEASHKAVGQIDTVNKPVTESIPRNIPPSSTSISHISRAYDQNNGILLNSLNSDIDQRKFVADQGHRSPGEQPKAREVQMNGIPLQNQITCSVEIHREKSLTPVSLKDWIDGAKPRTESINSITKEITLQESSV
ncbi:uncharacterized protein LOC110461901 isoform X2 [Mizuhopecten yessoensis]|uniref:uncharacterized protein LOC110461901 isoform X2 n=1 Tax=Mizuhopecten yessoensis TaxID=6573 RepID=UPI000B45ABD5|nr:uncharacterized protein LOC110461901 isoform X2 [Mizuhopecten yessoensis]